jgi:Acetyl-CoA carboxylase, central region
VFYVLRVYAARCRLLRVIIFKVIVSMFFSDGTNVAATLPLRSFLFNPTGHVLRIENYVETTARPSGNVHYRIVA